MQSPLYAGPAYKYISAESFKKLLTGRSIWYTRGDRFNDPYEANPYMVPVGWKDMVKLDKSNVQMNLALATSAFHQLFSKLYITCFSMRSNSQLMWSHYADAHKGICFGMDLPGNNPEIYTLGDPVPVAVTYCKSLFDEREKRHMKSEDLPLYMSTFKSDEWAYEQEVRMVLHTGNDIEGRFKIINDGYHATVPLDIKRINKVIFGARLSVKDEDDIVKLFCNQGHLPEFYRMDLNPVTLEFFEERLPIREAIMAFNKNSGNGEGKIA
ncbi:DUF2971 domain-containing protein [Mucilaginibacter terrae]|uniref:DUF2971 domain-containing protein n=1 Tax=Mucilaginibacter terrae TaxID=1955052 RepID=A0ABU3GNE5_9SPHI|nr:DUF2971 domain-containing protein [Mucilaginibacter terrae]MDT3401314.1 hypothetical protein [Mucilaginibacter terrae]